MKCSILFFTVTMIAAEPAFQVQELWRRGPFTFFVPCPGTVAGDLNGDGVADLVVTDFDFQAGNESASLVTILTGKGDGTFSEPQLLDSYYIDSVRIVDFDGDGLPDIAVSGVIADLFNDVRFWKGDGRGGFSKADGLAIGDFVLSDFNGDGVPDIVSDYSTGTPTKPSYQTCFYRGLGQGHFQVDRQACLPTTVWPIHSGDFDGDGNKDLLVVQDSLIRLLPGNGNGTFRSPSVSLPYPSGAVTVAADLNGDGITDLVVGEQSGGLVVYLGARPGGLSARATYAVPPLSSVYVADFDGDGKPDVAVVASESAGSLLFKGIGEGSFHAPQPLLVSSGCPIIAADMDGDGIVDMASVRNDAFQVWFAPAAPQTRTSTTPIPGYHVVTSMGAADLDGDGITDLAVVRDSILWMWPGRLGGGFAEPVQLPVHAGVSDNFESQSAPWFADLNGDGIIDVVIPRLPPRYFDNQVSVQLGLGGGKFAEPLLYPAPGALVAVTDFDGDGFPDLVTSNQEVMTLFAGDGAGGFRGPVRIYKGSHRFIEAGNYRRGGITDLLLWRFDTQDTVLLTNDGSGVFGAPVTVAPNCLGYRTADVNDDGLPDLISSCGTHLGYGGGTFRSPLGIANWPNLCCVRFAVDVDGDGRVDLILRDDWDPPWMLRGNGDGTFQPQGILLPVQGDMFVNADFGAGKPELVVASKGVVQLLRPQ